MKKILSSVCAAAMLTLPFATGVMAMPKGTPSTLSPIILAQSASPGGDGQSGGAEIRRWDGRDRGEWRDRSDSERFWRDRRDGPRGEVYYRGHRGYRDPRPGYRRHGDFWFPPAAFIAGAIVGGALTAQEPPIRYRPRGNAHIDWCYNRYRSYRASDNTFQPYNGPRRQCQSPYG